MKHKPSEPRSAVGWLSCNLTPVQQLVEVGDKSEVVETLPWMELLSFHSEFHQPSIVPTAVFAPTPINTGSILINGFIFDTQNVSDQRR